MTNLDGVRITFWTILVRTKKYTFKEKVIQLKSFSFTVLSYYNRRKRKFVVATRSKTGGFMIQINEHEKIVAFF